MHQKHSECKRGHPFVLDSYLSRTIFRNGKAYEERICRECRRIRQRLSWQKQKDPLSCSAPSSPQPEQSLSGDPLLDAFSAAVHAATLKK